jgi:hypothetical protein
MRDVPPDHRGITLKEWAALCRSELKQQADRVAAEARARDKAKS